MRPERQIKERIEIYEAQIEEYETRIKLVNSYSEREYYRNLIRKNLDALDLLKWVVDKTWAEAQSEQMKVVVCTCKKPIPTTSSQNLCDNCGKPRRR